MANEKRLIDAEAVRHKINAFAASVVYRGAAEMFTGKDTCNPHEYTRGYERGILDAQKIVCGQDPVDAVEVVHGRWIHASNKPGVWIGMKCSLCGARIRYSEFTNGNHNYCHKCGAKMDGDGNGNL